MEWRLTELEFAVMILLPLMIVWLKRPMSFAAGPRWACGISLAVGLTIALPSRSHVSAAHPAGLATANLALEGKQREGTRVNGLVGSLTHAARRWTFTSEAGDITYRILENQSLERIVKAIQEDPEDIHWKVSGQLTEFLDENFLLIERTERSARAKK